MIFYVITLLLIVVLVLLMMSVIIFYILLLPLMVLIIVRLDFQCPCFSADHKPEKLPNLFPYTGAYAGIHRYLSHIICQVIGPM